MKLVLIQLVLALSTCLAQRPYRPIPNPQNQIHHQSGPPIKILSQQQEVNFDGSYQWSYQTENGISAQENGVEKPGSPESIKEAQGSFQYTADDGTPISLQYIANENGFQPQGSHLPTPPPIPEAIQRSLEWNAAHPEEDDGGNPNPRGFRRP